MSIGVYLMLARLRDLHRPDTAGNGRSYKDPIVCAECGRPYPCLTRQLTDRQ